MKDLLKYAGTVLILLVIAMVCLTSMDGLIGNLYNDGFYGILGLVLFLGLLSEKNKNDKDV